MLIDKIVEIAAANTNGAVQMCEHMGAVLTHEDIEGKQTVTKRKEVEVQQYTPANTTVNVSQHRSQTPTTPQVVMQPTVSLVRSPPQQPSPCWRKYFKISGQIGEPGQKDKLTFSSLAHQIENRLNRGYPEIEIVNVIIRGISPGSQLRSYLEGKPHLTLPTLRRILLSHFQERSATELYKQLASAAQQSKETPQSFLMRALDL